MNTRREFIASASLAASGCVFARTPLAHFVAPGEIKAFLLHLGHNMWCDWVPPDVDLNVVKDALPPNGSTPLPDTELRNKGDLWRTATDYIAARGMNMIVVDLGEGLVYPSHPELTIKGAGLFADALKV